MICRVVEITNALESGETRFENYELELGSVLKGVLPPDRVFVEEIGLIYAPLKPTELMPGLTSPAILKEKKFHFTIFFLVCRVYSWY